MPTIVRPRLGVLESRSAGAIEDARVTDFRDPELQGSPAGGSPLRWLLHRLVGQSKRAPVDAEHQRQGDPGARRDEIPIRLHRFLWIHVDAAHERPRVVGSDRHHRKIERAASRPDLTELGVVGGVAGEESPPSFRFEREAAPERPVAIEETAAAEVSRRRRRDPERPDRRRLPPLQLNDVLGAPAPDVGADSGWNDLGDSRLRFGDPLHG